MDRAREAKGGRSRTQPRSFVFILFNLVIDGYKRNHPTRNNGGNNRHVPYQCRPKLRRPFRLARPLLSRFFFYNQFDTTGILRPSERRYRAKVTYVPTYVLGANRAGLSRNETYVRARPVTRPIGRRSELAVLELRGRSCRNPFAFLV